MAKGLLKSLSDLLNRSGSGSSAQAGITVKEQGIGASRKTVLAFRNVTVAVNDDAGVAGWLTSKIYDFPAGMIAVKGVHADLALTVDAAGVNADWDGDFAVGTAGSTDGSALTSTLAAFIPSTATPQASGSATTAKGVTTAALYPIDALDGTSTAIDCYLNVLVDDADQDVTTTPTNMIFNGTVTIYWTNLGDI
jgi:hypothetical protein